MWPSPDTRSPGANPDTSLPTSTTTPQYSCPTAIGTGMAFCAPASQLKLCRSAPQIAVRLTRINTSFGPTVGFGTSCRSMPTAARALTNACMMLCRFVGVDRESNDAELFAHERECGDGLVELLASVRRRLLRANARLAVRDHRERKADDINTVIQQTLRELGRDLGITQHHWNDRMFTRHQVEPRRGHFFSEVSRIVPQA